MKTTMKKNGHKMKTKFTIVEICFIFLGLFVPAASVSSLGNTLGLIFISPLTAYAFYKLWKYIEKDTPKSKEKKK